MKESMAKKNDSILNLLARSPWWVSVILSGISYLILKFIIPTIKIQQDLGHAFTNGLIQAAPMLAPMENNGVRSTQLINMTELA